MSGPPVRSRVTMFASIPLGRSTRKRSSSLPPPRIPESVGSGAVQPGVGGEHCIFPLRGAVGGGTPCGKNEQDTRQNAEGERMPVHRRSSSSKPRQRDSIIARGFPGTSGRRGPGAKRGSFTPAGSDMAFYVVGRFGFPRSDSSSPHR